MPTVQPSFRAAFAVVALLVFAATLPAQGPRRAETDVSYVPDDAFFVFLVRPRQMIAKYGTKTEAPLDLMRKAALENAGMKVGDIDEFMFVAGFDPDEKKVEEPDPDLPRVRPDDWISGMMRFHNPPDRAKIVEKMFSGAAEADYEGKKYYQSKSQYQPSAWFPDEKTLVFGNTRRLKKIMKHGELGMGSLRHQLRRSDPTADGAMVLSMDTGKAWFKAVFADEEVPLPIKPILELPTHLDVAVVTADLSQDQPVTMLALAVDEKSAKYLTSVAEEFRKTLKKMFDDNRDEIAKNSLSPRAGALAVDVCDKLLSGIELEQEGRKIRGAVKAKGGLVAAAEMIVELFAAEYRQSLRWQRGEDLRQIHQALMEYQQKHGRYPPAASYGKDGQPLLSWRVHLLPYLPGGNDLYKQFHLDEAWDSEHNKTLLNKMPTVFAFDRKAGGAHTRLLAAVGQDTVIRAKQSAKQDDIKDDKVHTVVLLEVSAKHAVPWTKPADYAAAADDIGQLVAPDEETHFMVLTADGDARQIKKSKITADAMHDFFTIAGGEKRRVYQYSY